MMLGSLFAAIHTRLAPRTAPSAAATAPTITSRLARALDALDTADAGSCTYLASWVRRDGALNPTHFRNGPVRLALKAGLVTESSECSCRQPHGAVYCLTARGRAALRQWHGGEVGGLRRL